MLKSIAQRGFSLLEVLVAMGIVALSFGAILTTVTLVIRARTATADQLVMANLAREGLEIVRNLRDTQTIYNCESGPFLSSVISTTGAQRCGNWLNIVGSFSATGGTAIDTSARYIVYLPKLIVGDTGGAPELQALGAGDDISAYIYERTIGGAKVYVQQSGGFPNLPDTGYRRYITFAYGDQEEDPHPGHTSIVVTVTVTSNRSTITLSEALNNWYVH